MMDPRDTAEVFGQERCGRQHQHLTRLIHVFDTKRQEDVENRLCSMIRWKVHYDCS